MMHVNLTDQMRDACRAVGIAVPRTVKPGQWAKSAVDGKARTNTSGRVLIFDDETGGIAHNWVTGAQQVFRLDREAVGKAGATPKRDPQAEKREREEREAVFAACERIVRASSAEPHPYLAAKGFPDERGLVCADLWRHLPPSKLGEIVARALPEGEGPWLIVPGRIGKQITTVQFIGPDGSKKNILKGKMGGASYRIATGRETWVAEGIATAMSVRAALRFLGRSATVLSAFSAANVAKVASTIPGAIIAADHDKPLPQLHGKGTGEFHAAASGCRWVMPPVLGDFNDMHMSDGLRAVAMLLREAKPP